jgi:hypothetical protein
MDMRLKTKMVFLTQHGEKLVLAELVTGGGSHDDNPEKRHRTDAYVHE